MPTLTIVVQGTRTGVVAFVESHPEIKMECDNGAEAVGYLMFHNQKLFEAHGIKLEWPEGL